MRQFKQLSKAERHVIQKMTYSGLCKNYIGHTLGRHHSTIYNEYNRNKTIGYKYEEAQNKANNRRHLKSKKLDCNGFLRLLVVSLLIDKNSPELIAFYLKENFPDEPSMHISYESIYQWI